MSTTASPVLADSKRPQQPALSLTEELRQMKQAGLPTNPKDLQVPLPPENRNAATFYRQLVALVKSKPVTGDDKVATDGVGRRPLTAEQAAKLRLALTHRADIGNLIHHAVALPDCVFDRQWAQGASMLFPEFATMRLALRWLSAESALQLYEGKPLDALRTQALGFRVGKHCAHDPMLIAYLVSLATDSITLAGLQRILYAAGGQTGVAEAVQHTLETDFQPHSLAHGLRGEIILPLLEIAKSRKGKPEDYEKAFNLPEAKGVMSDIPKLSAEDRRHFDRFIDRSEAVMLHSLRQVILEADLPYPQAHRAFQQAEADIATHRMDAAYTTLCIVMPIYGQAIVKKAQIEAAAATVRGAAALLAWKVGRSQFPAKIDGVLRQIPIDPFDRQPLRYKKEGAGFVLYSVGPTGKFEGGSASNKPDALESVFRYPMPTYIK